MHQYKIKVLKITLQNYKTTVKKMVFEHCIYIHKEWDIRSSALLKKKKKVNGQGLEGEQPSHKRNL